MAKVKITGHASGTGVFTLTAPNSNTDRTITLPDADVTLGTDATKLPLAGGALTGAVTTNSTFDGRDVAADGVLATNALPKAGGNMTGPINITANTTAMTFNTPSSGQNSWITWKDNGAAKWEMNKNIANNFNIYSYALGGNSLALLPDGRGLSQFTAKGWVRFNGSTINDSHNVSSVSVSATGQYRVFWDVDFANANYAVGGMGHADRLISFDGAPFAAYIDLNSYATSGSREGGNYESIIAFGS